MRPHADLHRRARRAPGVGAALRRRPRSRPYVDEWERRRRFPDDAVPPLRRARLPRPPLSRRVGAAATATSRPESCSSRSSPRCGAAAIAMAISVQSDMATPALAEFGTDDQRERWLRPAIAGDEDRRDRDHRARRRLRCRRASGRAPCATATCGASRARRCSSPTDTRADFLTLRRADRSRVRATAASPCSSSTRRCPASRCRARSTSSGCGAATPRRSRSTTSPVPHADLIGLEPGQGFAQLMWQLQYERLARRGRVRRPRRRRSSTTRSSYARERTDVRPCRSPTTR